MLAPHVREACARWSDEELLRRMLARENSAWCEFWRRYRARVSRAIRGTTARFSRVLRSADADDIAAEFLWQLQLRDMRKLRDFDPARGRLDAWIDLLARRTAIDYLRRRRSGMLREVLVETEPSDPGPDPLTCVRLRAAWRTAAATFDALSDQDRAVLEALLLEDCPMPQLSRKLGLTPQAMYARKHRFRQKLTDAMLS